MSEETLPYQVLNQGCSNVTWISSVLVCQSILPYARSVVDDLANRRNRMTFSTGEVRISEWMEENAKVAWLVCDEPWKLEEELISTVDLPLNLDQNRHHAFHSVLSQIRREAKMRARELPVLPK